MSAFTGSTWSTPGHHLGAPQSPEGDESLSFSSSLSGGGGDGSGGRSLEADLKDLKRTRLTNKNIYYSKYTDFVAKHFVLECPEVLDLEHSQTLLPSFKEFCGQFRDGGDSNSDGAGVQTASFTASACVNEEDTPATPPAAFAADFLPSLGAGLFKVEVFSPVWCERLIHEMDRFQIWAESIKLPLERPNSMNKFGLILNMLPGFVRFFDELLFRYVQPLATSLFPMAGGATLDSHHTFTVEYRGTGAEGEAKLAYHVDDAEVTLNICLGQEFEGGNLYFRGQRCDEHVNTQPLESQVTYPEEGEHPPNIVTISESSEVAHQKYCGLLHIGRNRHGAHEVTAGRRVNLIMWCRSSDFRARQREQRTTCGEFCGVSDLHANWMGAYT